MSVPAKFVQRKKDLEIYRYAYDVFDGADQLLGKVYRVWHGKIWYAVLPGEKEGAEMPRRRANSRFAAATLLEFR